MVCGLIPKTQLLDRKQTRKGKSGLCSSSPSPQGSLFFRTIFSGHPPGLALVVQSLHPVSISISELLCGTRTPGNPASPPSRSLSLHQMPSPSIWHAGVGGRWASGDPGGTHCGVRTCLRAEPPLPSLPRSEAGAGGAPPPPRVHVTLG